jgi:hypothetical protein
VADSARALLVLRGGNHLDSLIERLREPKLRRGIEMILSGSMLPGDLLNLRFAFDLGLVATTSRGLSIANPIYRELIPRALSSHRTEQS